jgi:hypothetical protein
MGGGRVVGVWELHCSKRFSEFSFDRDLAIKKSFNSVMAAL